MLTPLGLASWSGAAWLLTPVNPTTELEATAPARTLATPAWTVAEPAGVAYSFQILWILTLYTTYFIMKIRALVPFGTRITCKIYGRLL